MGEPEIPWERQQDAFPVSPVSSRIGDSASAQSAEELKEESRKIRRLQMLVNMVMQVIAQDHTLTVDEASEMVADTRRAALVMFPDKELAFDLIYWPRLQRLMRERYRMQ
jgi:pyridoxal/pyridoxine/pyridoxamine kinase